MEKSVFAPILLKPLEMVEKPLGLLQEQPFGYNPTCLDGETPQCFLPSIVAIHDVGNWCKGAWKKCLLLLML